MEDVERYLNEVVDPTIADFEQNPTSVRHAFLACVATFHCIDYLAYPRNSRTLREQFKIESHEFAEIDRVAHAFKHVRTGHESQGTEFNANEVIERPPEVWGKMVWGLSRWDDPVGGVTFDRNRDADLLKLVKQVRDLIRNKTSKAKLAVRVRDAQAIDKQSRNHND